MKSQNFVRYLHRQTERSTVARTVRKANIRTNGRKFART